MLVYQAETGREIISPVFTSVKQLVEFQQAVEELTGVPASDQILMTGDGDQLREEHLVTSYAQTPELGEAWSSSPTTAMVSPSNSPKLPFSSPEQLMVFVYDRQLFIGQSGADGLVEAPELEQTHHQEDVSEQQLIDYRQRAKRGSVRERCDAYGELFWHHHRQGQAYAGAAIINAAYCDQFVAEQRIQAMSLGVALKNLQIHAGAVVQTFDQSRSMAQKELTKRDNLLRSFQADMKTLASITIHKALSTDQNGILARDVTRAVHLIDYIVEESIRDNARICLDHHESVMDQMKLVTDTIRDIQENNTAEQRRPLGVDFASLDIALNETEICVQQLEQHAQLFERDYHRSKSMMNDLLSGPPSLAGEKLTALDHLIDIHTQDYLSICERSDRYIRNTVDKFVQVKRQLTIELLSRLQHVSRIQSSIASISPHLNELNALMTEQSDNYNQLLRTHRMPIAYGACLVEIARRNEYTDVMVRVAGELAEAMAKLRSQELKRRENFALEVKQYIPFSIPGIDETPPQLFERELIHIKGLMTPETGGANDSPLLSINKLHATMLKMMHQVDHIPVDFDRVIYKTTGLDKSENIVKPNVFGSQLGVPRHRSTTPQLTVRGGGNNTPVRSHNTSHSSGHASPVEEMMHPLTEKVKTYEARIRSLEHLLQQNYRSSQILHSSFHSDPTPNPQPSRSQSPALSSGSTHLSVETLRKELEEQKQRYDTLQQQHTELNKQLSVAQSAYNDREALKQAEIEQLIIENKQLKHQLASQEEEKKQVVKQLSEQCCRLEQSALTIQMAFDEQAVQEYKMVNSINTNIQQWSELIVDQLKMNSITKVIDQLNPTNIQVSIEQFSHLLDTLIASSNSNSNVILSLESALKEANDQLEEWEMLCRMSCEQLQIHYRSIKDMVNLSELKNLPSASALPPSINIDDDSPLATPNRITTTALPWFNETAEEASMMSSSIEVLVGRIPLQLPKSPLFSPSSSSSLVASSLVGTDGEFTMTRVLTRSREALLNLYREMTRTSSVTTTAALTDLVPRLHRWFETLSMETRRLREEKARLYEEKIGLHGKLADSIAFRNFKIDDLVLFLPTRNPKAWAAFNIDAPHYFLQITERFEHYTRKRDWIVAKILTIKRYQVNTEIPSSNPFDLAHNAFYYLIEAKYYRSRSETAAQHQRRRTRSVKLSQDMMSALTVTIPDTSNNNSNTTSNSASMSPTTAITVTRPKVTTVPLSTRSLSCSSAASSPTSPRPPRTSSMPPTRLIDSQPQLSRPRPMSMISPSSSTTSTSPPTNSFSSSFTTAGSLRRLLSRRSQPVPLPAVPIAETETETETTSPFIQDSDHTII